MCEERERDLQDAETEIERLANQLQDAQEHMRRSGITPPGEGGGGSSGGAAAAASPSSGGRRTSFFGFGRG
jgi:hypothetical protein